ncbi:MAG: serine acetyltransferase [Planctomycetes bacterium]|nr:serine acetyltransferase [Planctomycetota bacterium]
MNDSANEGLDKLTADILASYAEDEETTRIGDMFLPSKTRIITIINELRMLIFPGYFGHKMLSQENVRYHVGNLLTHVGTELADQINHCLCTDYRYAKYSEPEDCSEEAARLANKLLGRIPHIRRMLAMDARAAVDGDPAARNVCDVIYCYPGYYALTVYRIAHELWDLGVPLMARIMTEHAHTMTGMDVHPAARIGERFFVDHATGVVIGETTIIGNNVRIYQGVTLGGKSYPKDENGRLIKGLRRHPKVGNNVTIWPNATILGGETVIGDGVTVGGNAYVTESIEAGHLVKQEVPNLTVVSKRSSSKRKMKRSDLRPPRHDT